MTLPECETIRDRIEPYLDGDVSPAETNDLENHFLHCEACKYHLEHARQILAEIRRLPQEDMPGDTQSKILGKTLHRSNRPFFARIPKRIYAPIAVAAAACLIIVAVLAGNTQSKPESPPISDEVAKAQEQLEWTLAYLSRVNDRAIRRVRDDIIAERIAPPIRTAIKNAVFTDNSTETPLN